MKTIPHRGGPKSVCPADAPLPACLVGRGRPSLSTAPRSDAVQDAKGVLSSFDGKRMVTSRSGCSGAHRRGATEMRSAVGGLAGAGKNAHANARCRFPPSTYRHMPLMTAAH